MKVILHIGLHKTGSTAIQAMLHVNRAALRQRRIDYPDTALFGPGHHLAGWKFQSPRHDVDLRRLGCNAPDGESLLAAMIDEAQRRKCGTLIASSETFSSIQYYDPRRIARAFEGHDVTVLGYVRRQDLWLESRYNQGVKSPGLGAPPWTNPFATFVAEVQATGLLDYAASFGRWAAAFGRPRVQLHLYERSRFPGGDVTRHFCRVVGIPEDALSFPPMDLNPSLDCHSVHFIRRLNGIALTRAQRKQAVRLSHAYMKKAHAPTHGYLFGLAERERLLSSLAESNRRFCRDFLGNESEFELAPAERERLAALEPDMGQDRFFEILAFVMPELLRLQARGDAKNEPGR